MSSAASDSRKRSKKRYVAGHGSKRWKGCRELEVGMQGILITCNMNQRKCTAEAFNLLNEYAEQLYGPEKLEQNAGGDSEQEEAAEEEEEEDVDAALKKEVAQLKASGVKQERRFRALESGANNVVFIKTHNLESDKLVHHILTDLHTTKKKKSRVILRMLPVTGTCKAFQEDMMRYLSTFLEPWFKSPNKATYKIAFKARNSSHNKRDEIIKSIAGLVATLNPKNKVDLTKPQLTVIIEVIKAVCCISVVKDYWLYKKYNVQEVVKEDAAPTAPPAPPTESDAAEQAEATAEATTEAATTEAATTEAATTEATTEATAETQAKDGESAEDGNAAEDEKDGRDAD